MLHCSCEILVKDDGNLTRPPDFIRLLQFKMAENSQDQLILLDFCQGGLKSHENSLQDFGI